MVSMKDIAAKCGVTVATVSKALSDKDDIGEEMKIRIRKTAEELGYFPNAAARALKTNRSYSLGVLFVDGKGSGLTHDFFSVLLDSFKLAAEEKGYDISFVNNFVGKKPMSYREHCLYRNVDGVVIACVDFFSQDVIELAYSNIPTVSIDHEYTGRSAVMSDNVSGMSQLVKYIYSMGHRDIAFIHGQRSLVTEARLGTFLDICKQLGVTVPNEYIIEGLYNDFDNGIESTKKVMTLPKPPTCIIYPDDLSCIGGVSELRRMGLRVPEDISVAGYDGVKVGRFHSPKLTTVSQNASLMGRIAAEQLISIVESSEGSSRIKASKVMVPCTLIKGESVVPPKSE